MTSSPPGVCPSRLRCKLFAQHADKFFLKVAIDCQVPVAVRRRLFAFWVIDRLAFDFKFVAGVPAAVFAKVQPEAAAAKIRGGSFPASRVR